MGNLLGERVPLRAHLRQANQVYLGDAQLPEHLDRYAELALPAIDHQQVRQVFLL